MVFGPELMAEHTSSVQQFSKMTLAVFKDSAWYQPDMTSGVDYTWAKNAGCGLFSLDCPADDLDEVCKAVDADACSEDHLYRTRCLATRYNSKCPMQLVSESCKFRKINENPQFTYGKNSVCLAVEISAQVQPQPQP